jgi:hypothetical protein
MENILPKKNFNVIEKWAIGNPIAKINLWYDSEFTLKSALENTQDYFSHEFNEQIVLKDIRKLRTVEDNPDIFSQK